MTQLNLYLTTDYPCSYLPERRARNLVVDPRQTQQNHYQGLLLRGFRRSGEHVYRPHCHACNACQSLRVSSLHFQASRSQRRAWQGNQDLRLGIHPMHRSQEHYRLFQRYVRQRHEDGGMDTIAQDDFFAFTASRWCDSYLWELRDANQHLLCGAVVDHLNDGFSAVYSYFEPSASSRALGTLIILHQLEQARLRHLPWVYLGYYIRDCRKMTYKSRFQRHQRFVDGEWQWWLSTTPP